MIASEPNEFGSPEGGARHARPLPLAFCWAIWAGASAALWMAILRFI